MVSVWVIMDREGVWRGCNGSSSRNVRAYNSEGRANGMLKIIISNARNYNDIKDLVVREFKWQH